MLGLLAVELVASVLPVAFSAPPSAADYGFAVSLVVMAAAYTWAALRWEERRAMNADGHSYGLSTNLFGIWCFAAITLPIQLCAAVIVLIELSGVPARRAIGPTKAHRVTYSLAVAVLDVCAAIGVLHLPIPRAGQLVLAALAYFTVNVVGYCFAMALTRRPGGFRILMRPKNCVIEFACLAVGAATLLTFEAGMAQFAWLSVPVALIGQRCVVRYEMRREPAQSATEPLMVAEAWQVVAREVVRASAAAAVLRVDSSAPEAVAEVARVQAGCDAIGQNGPNGLAILLTDCPGPNADAIAARLRSALSGNKIDARVAVAAKPRDGHTLADLLAVSEAELIAMKAASASPTGQPER